MDRCFAWTDIAWTSVALSNCTVHIVWFGSVARLEYDCLVRTVTIKAEPFNKSRVVAIVNN